MRLTFIASLALALAAPFASAQTSPAPQLTYKQQAALGIGRLQQDYNLNTGLYMPSTGWWNSANAITMLDDYSLVAHTKEFAPIFANTFTRAQVRQIPDASIANDKPGFPSFLNKYYDDEGWWVLAWTGAYDVTHDKKYLAMSESIFADMAASWDSTCDGGIWWSKDKTYKNAIANELFLSAAAHLAARTKGAERAKYLDWAQREWKWFNASGMINDQHLVNDGLNIRTCKNNQRKVWSYNQGVLIGGLVELNRVAPDPQLIGTAQTIAASTLATLVDANGIMTDHCEPKCGGDGIQFKGIFVRNLMALAAASPAPRYQTFVDANADSIWKNSRGPDNRLGQTWAGPLVDADKAGSQISALDALTAAAQFQTMKKKR